ncbi:MAG TPA: hypothetical protein VGA66_13065 [Mycobacterium sp.]|jgi:hypothetical protein
MTTVFQRSRRSNRLASGIQLTSARVARPAVAVLGAPPGQADNKRLNNSVAANVYTVQKPAGCQTEIKKNPQLAAQWHANDDHALAISGVELIRRWYFDGVVAAVCGRSNV